MNKLYKISTILILLFSIDSQASIGNDMENFFNSLGAISNRNQAGYIKGTKSGYVTGGGFSMRSRVSNTQLASVQLPSLKAGCGGIDFYAGGFSFINEDQLISLGKNMLSNAPGVMFQMALDNVSPKIGSTLKYFQNLSREINELNINSCKTTTALLKDPGSVVNAVKEKSCRTWGLASGKFQDASKANASCTSGGQASSTYESMPDNQKPRISNVNLIWEAMKDASLINVSDSDSTKIAEMMMTLTGTVIIKGGSNDNQASDVSLFSSKIIDQNVFNSFLSGGVVEILQCDNYEKCLNPTKRLITISEKKSFLGMVNSYLEKLQIAMKNDNDTDLGAAMDILTFSGLPIMEMMKIHLARYNTVTEIDSLSEYIAINILDRYFMSILTQVNESSLSFNKGAEEKVFKTFFIRQDNVTAFVKNKMHMASQKSKDSLDFIARSRVVKGDYGLTDH
jgi:conjugative transfer pilus assembly protein TraH